VAEGCEIVRNFFSFVVWMFVSFFSKNNLVCKKTHVRIEHQALVSGNFQHPLLNMLKL
jgi:hypothetical protein